MNDLFHGFEFIHAYIDDILILTNGYYIDHVHKLELTLTKLNKMDLNVILKSISSDELKWNIWFSG